MMELLGVRLGARALGTSAIGNLAAHRHAIDPQQIARAVIGLHQGADGEMLAGGFDHPARGADPALELVADHARAAADIALGHRAAAGGVQRGMGHGLGDRKGLGIGEPAVMGLGHDRQMPGRLDAELDGIAADGIAHGADAMGAGDADGAGEQALLGEPDGAGHLAIAVEAVEAGEAVVVPDVAAAGPDHGDAGADHRRLVADQGRMADLHPGDIGDGIERPRRQRADGDAEIAKPRAAHEQSPPVSSMESIPGISPSRACGA